jgi:NodT family efflux transporter outer membrane factor (OMF) lipoprotein
MAALSLLALAACSVGPGYTRPDMPAPPAWNGPPATGSAQWPSASWWSGFGSPTLDELMTAAQSANDDIAAAVARVREADANVRVVGSALLPSLDASAGAARQREVSPTTGALTFNSFTTGLTAAYELDFWGKNRALRTAAMESAAANRYDRATVELSVMAGVASTYFTVLELRDRLAVAHNNLESATTILEGLKLEQTVGTVNALDVAQQATVVATLNASIPPLEQQLRENTDALAILVGKAPQGFEITTGSLEGMSRPGVSPGLPSELLARRPDVAEAESQLKAAHADIVAARAAFFPSIDLTAAGGFESTQLSHLLEPANRTFTLGAGITQPIFRGGALLGEYRFSEARYDELLANYHKAVISALGNVEDALAAVQQTEEQLRRQQAAVDAAQRAYDFAQTQFHAGTINILTVLITETALFTAEDTLSQVKLAHLTALVGLYKALGGGWEAGKET